mgnify:CR=1 FL=1
MKKLDNVIYIIIKTLGIIAITIISYFIIFTTMSLMNKIDFLEILTDLSIYKIFYNIIDKMFVPVTFIIFIIAIPYLIIFIILIIILIIKYIKFKEKKKKQIITITTLLILTICFILKGVTTFSLTNNYEIKVNSKINEISNIEVRDFLEKEIDGNKYVYIIKIRQGFPDDYIVQIHYKDITNKIEYAFLSDSDYDFIERNAKDITNELTIRSIILILVGDLFCIYLLKYVLKEFKRITMVNDKTNTVT